ncbi:MAG: GTP cyclohydrolase I FolE [Alteromonadaceae bacterium]|nr:GTP cyclohydrolase I FolE [Alteromonadaceae bacterium]
MEQEFKSIIEAIGEDPQREGLKDTPERASKALKYLTRGYQQDLDSVINGALFNSDCDSMVVVNDIELYSLCEHHMLPFTGRCHIGYIPNGKVLGLSKLARIVDMFARRLQIQEKLTQEIAHAIMDVTNAHGVGVVMSASHLCMRMRGVQKQNSEMKTSCMLGSFLKCKDTRFEFLQLIKE